MLKPSKGFQKFFKGFNFQEFHKMKPQQGEESSLTTCARPASGCTVWNLPKLILTASEQRTSSKERPKEDFKTRNRYTPSFLLPCSRCCGEFSCPAPAAVGSLRHRTPSALPPSSRKRKVSSFSALLAFPPPFPVLAKVSRTRLLTDGERLPSVRMTPVCRGLSGPPVCVVSSGGWNAQIRSVRVQRVGIPSVPLWGQKLSVWFCSYFQEFLPDYLNQKACLIAITGSFCSCPKYLNF